MALKKKGKFFFGDSQLDIREKLLVYSIKNGYSCSQYGDVCCTCGSKLFRLNLDDDAGAAVRVCTACSHQHPIGDSQDYLDDAHLGECEYPCGAGVFEITVGLALYDDSEDVRWIYLGCRCPKCGLVACYGDWKNEFIGYQEFLSRI